MLLILGDGRLNFRKFPDLVTKRLGIAADKVLATPSARVGQARHHVLALLGGDQSSLLFGMAWLSAPFTFGLG